MEEEIKEIEEKIYELKRRLYELKCTKECKECGKIFIAKGINAQYCSHRCCQKSYKKRRTPEQIKRDNEISKLRMRILRAKRKAQK